MTLEDFTKKVLGAEAQNYTQEQIESSFALYNAVFDVAFYNFLQNRKQKIQKSSKKC